MAERVGFEPTVLAHTAFRERHLQPLGHLSAGEDSKGPGRTAVEPGFEIGRDAPRRVPTSAGCPPSGRRPRRVPRVLTPCAKDEHCVDVRAADLRVEGAGPAFWARRAATARSSCRARPPPAPAGGNLPHTRRSCGGGRAPSLQVTRVPCTSRAVGVRHGQAGSRTAGRGSSEWPGPLKARNRAPGPRPPRVRQRSRAAGELLPL